MRKLFTLTFLASILVCILCNTSFGQTTALKPLAKMISDSKTVNIQFKNSTPFVLNASPVFKLNTDAFANNITYAHLDLVQINNLHKTKNAALELNIPYKNNILSLELIEVNIFADGFKISTDISNEDAINY